MDTRYANSNPEIKFTFFLAAFFATLSFWGSSCGGGRHPDAYPVWEMIVGIEPKPAKGYTILELHTGEKFMVDGVAREWRRARVSFTRNSPLAAKLKWGPNPYSRGKTTYVSVPEYIGTALGVSLNVGDFGVPFAARPAQGDEAFPVIIGRLWSREKIDFLATAPRSELARSTSIRVHYFDSSSQFRYEKPGWLERAVPDVPSEYDKHGY